MKDNFLLYIPRKKHETFEIKKDSVKLIFYHEKFAEKAIRWLIKKPYVSDIQLDKLGSKVWLLIDGKRSVYDIGQGLLVEYGKTCEPVYERLIPFLGYLNKKGWISFDRGEQEKEL